MLVLLTATAVPAHKLLVAASLEKEGVLKIESFFPDGNPAIEIPVSLEPEDGRPPLSGRTDLQGTFRFFSLAPGKYRIVAGDPLGHRAETLVVIPGRAEASKADLLPPAKDLTPSVAASGTVPGRPDSSRGEPVPWGAILAGLGFIFGLTALIMVLNLQKEVRRTRRRSASGD
jgi:hypothetical protein